MSMLKPFSQQLNAGNSMMSSFNDPTKAENQTIDIDVRGHQFREA